MLRSSSPRPSSVVLVALAAIAAAGCPDVKPPVTPGEVERRTFTTNVADQIVVPRLETAVARGQALRETTAALAATDGTGAAEREAARTAWRELMRTWQELEVLHVGPAGSPPAFTGGQGLRERIYAWPQINACAVDQQVLTGEFGEAGWVETRLPNVVGLAAVEYALFVEGDGNACADTAALNANGTWAALGSAEIVKRRAAYAAVLAADVEPKLAGLRDAWTGPAGFAATLRTAGEPGSPFPTAQQALDELYAAMFFVELGTKDKKLAIPAGLHVDCPATSCPDKAENRFSRTSKESIVANLEATRAVFLGIDATGKDNTGFDDLLKERGAADLATSMTANLDAAIAAARSFDGAIEDALATDPARVVALHGAVKAFTDDFKSTFASTLGLRVPDEGAGDND